MFLSGFVNLPVISIENLEQDLKYYNKKSVTLKFTLDEWSLLEKIAHERGFNSPYGLIKHLISNLISSGGENILRESREDDLSKRLTKLENEIKNINTKIGVLARRISDIHDILMEIKSTMDVEARIKKSRKQF